MKLAIVVYSDFLCPWCWNAATRLAAVQQQLAGDLEIEWRSYLLRPSGQPGRSLEKFRAYTQSWLRVAEDEPRAPFQVWASDAGPPSHSVPPHLVAKAAAALGADEGRRMRERLFRAYFAESRDISDRTTLRALWNEAELPDDAFASCDDPEHARRVLEDHEEAQALGANGVPAVRLVHELRSPAARCASADLLADQDFVLVGAQPEAVYLRWLRRVLEARAATA